MDGVLSPSGRLRMGLLLITLLAAAWRFHTLFRNSFYPDEALYATFARSIAVWRDPLLLAQPVDKPPLLFYVQALFYPLQGPVEWAARLPNMLASMVTIPLTGRLAGQLAPSPVRPAAVLLAALLVAAAPLAVQFSATAFLDPFFVALGVWAFYEAGRPAGATRSGLLWGLALATKYQAVLFIPLIFIRLRQSGGRFSHWLAGTAGPILAVFVWDFVRSGWFTLWDAQVRNYGGLQLRTFDGWGSEVQAWVDLLPFVLGWGWLLLPAALLALWGFTNGPSRPVLPLVWLPGFIIVYLAAHWLLEIPAWDRYLLPLVPLAAVWLAIGAAVTAARIRRRSLWFGGLLVLLPLLFWQGGLARTAHFPVGGSPAADDGIHLLVDALAGEPYGTVLYDHWYSWQLRYHLFDKKVYVSWFDRPGTLTRELAVFGRDGSSRYLLLPVDGRARAVLAAAARSGFAAEEVVRTDRAALYRLRPEGGP